MCRERFDMEWMLLPYQRYFEFTGRSRRKEYWMFTLLQFLIILALVAVAFAFSSAGEDAVMTVLYGGIGIWFLATFIPNLAVQVRRFHDQDLTGWLVAAGIYSLCRRPHSPGLHVHRRKTRTEQVRPGSEGRRRSQRLRMMVRARLRLFT